MILAGIYAVFGHSYLAVACIQAVIGGLTALLVVLVGMQLLNDITPALVAGCMFACHPLLIFATGLLYSETIYLFALVAFTYACLKMIGDARTKGWAVAAGVLLGASVLMKPNLMLFPLALFFWLWLASRDLHRALTLGGIAVLAMLTVVLPWTSRNYRVTGTLVPVSANSGLNLWQGNHPEADGAAYPLEQVEPLEGYSEVERDRTYQRWAVQQIRSDPARFLALMPRKIAKFFSPLQTSNRGRMVARLSVLVDGMWAAFLGLAVWGAFRTVGRSRAWMLIYLLVLYPIALTAVFYGATRYGMVIYPYLFLLAADSLVWVARCVKARIGAVGSR